MLCWAWHLRPPTRGCFINILWTKIELKEIYGEHIFITPIVLCTYNDQIKVVKVKSGYRDVASHAKFDDF